MRIRVLWGMLVSLGFLVSCSSATLLGNETVQSNVPDATDTSMNKIISNSDGVTVSLEYSSISNEVTRQKIFYNGIKIETVTTPVDNKNDERSLKRSGMIKEGSKVRLIRNTKRSGNSTMETYVEAAQHTPESELTVTEMMVDYANDSNNPEKMMDKLLSQEKKDAVLQEIIQEEMSFKADSKGVDVVSLSEEDVKSAFVLAEKKYADKIAEETLKAQEIIAASNELKQMEFLSNMLKGDISDEEKERVKEAFEVSAEEYNTSHPSISVSNTNSLGVTTRKRTDGWVLNFSRDKSGFINYLLYNGVAGDIAYYYDINIFAGGHLAILHSDKKQLLSSSMKSDIVSKELSITHMLMYISFIY